MLLRREKVTMEDMNFPICILKMNLQCCGDCPLRIKKLLQKVTGVYAITIDPKEGIVLVSGTAEPQVLIKAVEGIGKRPELYAYEKDPTKAKFQFRALLKRYADEDEDQDQDRDKGGDRDCDRHEPLPPLTACYGGETYGRRRFRMFGQPPEMQMPMQMPAFTLPPPVGPPGWLAAGPRPRYMVRYDQTVAAPRKPTPPYPFDFYYDTNFPPGNSPFHYFSDQHAQPCSIM